MHHSVVMIKWSNSCKAFIFYFLKFILFLFIYFWLCWVFVATRGLSLVAASGDYSSLQCACFSLRWLLLLWSTGSRRAAGFSSCGTQAQQLWLAGCRMQSQQLWHTGLVAPRHVGSSQTRDRTCVPCIGRRFLNHCATREVLVKHLAQHLLLSVHYYSCFSRATNCLLLLIK